MTDQPRVHLWTADDGLTPSVSSSEDARSAGTPAVFDSWIVDDGAAVAWTAHRARFSDGVGALFPDADVAQVCAFLDEVATSVPAHGAWWPRIEAHRRDPTTTAGAPQLVLRLRPAPEAGGDVILWTCRADLPSPKHPHHKGPDQPLYSRLRELAAEHGATDAVRLDGDGHVLETDHCALVWWREDTLCLPARGLPRLPSVTQEQIVALAAQSGSPVRQETVRPEDLDGLQIWALNAARGVQLVTEWRGEPAAKTVAAGPQSRQAAATWHQAWEESRADLSGR